MSAKHYLAFDLGASSGRAMLGTFDGHRFLLEEVHRFANGPVRVVDALHWDPLRLFAEMKRGLGMAAGRCGAALAGVGVDTWGVDFGLLGRGDVLLGNPYHYMDRRTSGTHARVLARVSREVIFARTGVQFLELNTLNQLFAMAEADHPWLQAAETLLLMPNLFMFLLSGEKAAEYTHASTTQLLGAQTRDWADALFAPLGLPRDIMPDIVAPGTVTGRLLPWIAEETGVGSVPVIAVGTHDTASAVAAVPAEAYAPWCYISSGTWSLMGVEVRVPQLTERVSRHNFTNEGGVGGTIRLLKNLVGLMPIQDCRRSWSRPGDEMTYDQLNALAATARPFAAVVNPDDPIFWTLGDRPEQVAAFCRRTGQPAPTERGEIVRSLLEGLALRARQVLGWIEEIVGQRMEVIHIVGGGSRNRLLCQFTASATGRPVMAGPAEATATGNVLVQALATGEIASVDEGRGLVRRSCSLVRYDPQETAVWEDAFGRFRTFAT